MVIGVQLYSSGLVVKFHAFTAGKRSTPMAYNKNIISLASSLGQLLTGWRFAQYSQQLIAPYVKRYKNWIIYDS
jgi:hypothetical protein